jgi:hypothetical protein
MGGSVGARARLDVVMMRKYFLSQESSPGCPSGSPSLYRLSYPGSTYGYKTYIKLKKTCKSEIKMKSAQNLKYGTLHFYVFIRSGKFLDYSNN